MSGTVVLGAQWGDEGKGKITDLLAADADVVIRYSGGPNAGHTIVRGERIFRLHHIPSGILYPQVTCLLGNGMVIDPAGLLEEIESLTRDDVDVSRLYISSRAHLIMPYHRLLDEANEASRGKKAIGTTGRGVGPTYADKAARHSLRIHHLLNVDDATDEIRRACAQANHRLKRLYNQSGMDPATLAENCKAWGERLRPHVIDTGLFLHHAIQQKQRVLFEGAQGTLLDIDHGTFPFVTSTATTIGGALTGTGVGPRAIGRIIGVTKAYTTRVGAGPFPTELFDAVGDRLVEQGHEYGTTTGRRRRAGWLDGVALRYAARINGLTELALTKLDVLTGFSSLRICTSYRWGEEESDQFPAQTSRLFNCQPVYEDLPGWSANIRTVRSFDRLPVEAQHYVQFLEELAGIPVSIISVGPDRDQTFFRSAE